MQRKAEKRPKWGAWDEYVAGKGFWESPRWQSADKAMSYLVFCHKNSRHNSLWRFFCSRRGKWWKLTWALATPNLSPYLATGGGIIFALFPLGKTNFLVIHSSIDFMSFIHLLSTILSCPFMKLVSFVFAFWWYWSIVTWNMANI